MPFAGFKRQAMKWRNELLKGINLPFEAVKAAMVRRALLLGLMENFERFHCRPWARTGLPLFRERLKILLPD